ncbi:FG-GAP-like repeat-containing protein [Gilvimarinus algae]|uniref:FG-GAP-like repeat-containing protein n=1 Tax=Gilvimarinus algae TaxID=3058037 RepID=A0ABT8TEK9_9GAMM|nr:FG-GAP-like repeat-containing protein [Gilvimarinus sp. SDUM040014]MDO3382371.1 FG-GAP-like repeat-containing protein [Gilvimarinus sp. SDUM040014]
MKRLIPRVNISLPLVLLVFSSWASAYSWDLIGHDLRQGDYNGDGQQDLYLQPLGDSFTADIPYDISLNLELLPALGHTVIFSAGLNYELTYQSSPPNTSGTLASHNEIIADFNRDGNNDVLIQAASSSAQSLIVLGYEAPGAPQLLLGLSALELGFDISSESATLRVEDVNDDGYPDIIISRTSLPDRVVIVHSGSALTQSFPYPLCTTSRDLDADCDGISDIHEVVFSSDPFNPDSELDGDGDGIANYDEFLAQDSRRDIVWSRATGEIQIWRMSETGPLEIIINAPSLDPEFTIKAVDDFDGDGDIDLLWRSDATGATVLNLYEGTGVFESHSLESNVEENEAIAVTGDFDGDNDVDLLWRNRATGDIGLWVLQNGTKIGAAHLGLIPLGYSIELAGDLDGDGDSDVIFQNPSDGSTRVLIFESGLVEAEYSLSDQTNLAYSLAALGDLNADGVADLFWRSVEGLNQVWLMDVDGLSSQVIALPAMTELSFSLELWADFDADGDADVLWRNSESGENRVWVLENLSLNADTSIYSISADYVLSPKDNKAVTSDSDSDGISDEWEFANGLDPLNPLDAALDFDMDGLANIQEFELQTNPHSADSDSDGMPDGWEVTFNFNPNDASDAVLDGDSDGFSNLEEYVAQTDPTVYTSDGDDDNDGMLDTWELANGFDPLNPYDAEGDADSDGLSNLDEFALGVDPNIADTDADGIPDGQEVLHGLNPNDELDALGDNDSDGLSNAEELTQVGSDINNPDTDNDGASDFDEHHGKRNPLVNEAVLIQIIKNMLL